jgi:signal peptidase
VFLSLVVLFVAAIVIGQLIGQPMVLGYVETGSMSPTLEPGDGFIAVPAAIAGPPEPGDVIVFQAQELHGGGLTTHRVVRKTEAGYITQGDANPFTDQDGAEPPVTKAQIYSHVLQINGQVLVIPNLGDVVMGVRGAFTGFISLILSVSGLDAALDGEFSNRLLLYMGSALVVLSFLFGSGNSRTSRRPSSRPGIYRPITILAILSLVVLVPATASMVLPAGTVQLDIVSSSNPSEDPLVIQAGETAEVEYRVFNDGFVPVVVFAEPATEGVTVEDTTFLLAGKSQSTTTIRVSAPEKTGAYRRQISESRYIPVLPISVIKSLHAIHPYLAIAAIDLVLFIGTAVLTIGVLGGSEVKLRSTSRNISLIDRIRRLL